MNPAHLARSLGWVGGHLKHFHENEELLPKRSSFDFVLNLRWTRTRVQRCSWTPSNSLSHRDDRLPFQSAEMTVLARLILATRRLNDRKDLGRGLSKAKEVRLTTVQKIIKGPTGEPKRYRTEGWCLHAVDELRLKSTNEILQSPTIICRSSRF